MQMAMITGCGIADDFSENKAASANGVAQMSI
jgi:hypothetical protein